MNSNCIINLAIAGAIIYLLLKDKQGGAVTGYANASKEPNFPTTAVAGRIGRGWTVYQEPAGVRYIERAVLTT